MKCLWIGGIIVLVFCLIFFIFIRKKELMQTIPTLREINKLDPKYYTGYPTKGSYVNDLKKCKEICLNILKKYKNAPNRTIIFDMDDTLVYTTPNNPKPPKIVNITKEGQKIFYFPPIQPIVRVAQYAKKIGYKVIIITARPPTSKQATIENCKMYNIPVDEVFTDSPFREDPYFKKNLRHNLSATHNIILTVGDRELDVIDPLLFGLQLPNPLKQKYTLISPQ